MSCSHRLAPAISPNANETINATVAWSYHLLARDEQRVFAVLARCRGGFNRGSRGCRRRLMRRRPARHPRTLARSGQPLSTRALLLRADSSVPTRPLYQILKPSMRTPLSSSPLRASARTRWRDSRAIARPKPPSRRGELFGPAQGEWLDRVRDDLESYRSALTWLIERGRPTEAANIAWGLQVPLGDPRALGRRPSMV